MKGGGKMYHAKVYVTLKKSVLDPQGVTVKHALSSMGYDDVQDVRVGKYLEVRLKEKNEAHAKAKLEEMCKKLFTNPVIEEFSYDLKEVKG